MKIVKIELDENTRDTVVGAIYQRVKKIMDSKESHHLAETKTLLEATKKMGLELIRDEESGELTINIVKK